MNRCGRYTEQKGAWGWQVSNKSAQWVDTNSRGTDFEKGTEKCSGLIERDRNVGQKQWEAQKNWVGLERGM